MDPDPSPRGFSKNGVGMFSNPPENVTTGGRAWIFFEFFGSFPTYPIFPGYWRVRVTSRLASWGFPTDPSEAKGQNRNAKESTTS